MDQLNALDVLKEEMENEELFYRVNAIHRIRVVATLLPNDKIKSQLIPFIDCI
jgi:serine/threonine-protein phosphatase 2A regulatory subunit A